MRVWEAGFKGHCLRSSKSSLTHTTILLQSPLSSATLLWPLTSFLTMVQYNVGLTPGVIVGFVLVLLVLLSMFFSTGYIIWRSRPGNANRALFRRKRFIKVDMENEGASAGDEKLAEDSANGTPSTLSDEYLTHTAPTLNLIISPSKSRTFKVETDGGVGVGVEVRVTPPSPALLPTKKSDRRLRFETVQFPQGENESVWWFI